jgi:predicted alpha/beta-fold hydrolase
MRLPGGHVGIVAGRTALSLWQRTVEFLTATKRVADGEVT